MLFTEGLSVRMLFGDADISDFKILYALLVNHEAALVGINDAASPGNCNGLGTVHSRWPASPPALFQVTLTISALPCDFG